MNIIDIVNTGNNRHRTNKESNLFLGVTSNTGNNGDMYFWESQVTKVTMVIIIRRLYSSGICMVESARTILH